jgi:hypothetical protein
MTLLVVYCLAVSACSSSPKSKVGETKGGSHSGGASSNDGGKANGGGDGGAGGNAGQSSATDFAGPLGRRCDDSIACETGLDCFLASGTEFGDYGPAGGLCTVRCTTDDECAKYADNSIDDAPRCVGMVPGLLETTICMPGCRLGDDTACGGRDEVSCWALSDSPSDGTARVCVPLCNGDQQCPAGTVCDGETNLCSSWASSGGLQLGDDCDATAATNRCSDGICLDFGTGGVCSSYCRRGTFPQCGGSGEDAICGWVYAGDEKAGRADTGMCAETCVCNADCSSGSYCAAHKDRVGMDKPGICTIGSGAGIESC